MHCHQFYNRKDYFSMCMLYCQFASTKQTLQLDQIVYFISEVRIVLKCSSSSIRKLFPFC